MVRVMVLWGLGFNCEEETQAAYKFAGADVTLVHVNELLREKYSVHDFQIVHFPGGFSFGDHLGAGRVLANRIRFKKTAAGKSFRDELLDFSKNGGFLFGICNGFQILLALGLLPYEETQRSLSLIENDTGQFQDRWVRCHFNPKSPLAKIWNEESIDLPIRHGQGRLLVRDDETGKRLEEQNLITLRYEDNPNGSFGSCAALCDPSGRILGMMPHPEAFLSSFNDPRWCGRAKEESKGQGLKLFENLVNYVASL